MEPVYKIFLTAVQNFLPEQRIITDSLRTLAYGTDASFYRLTPQIVLLVDNEEELIRVLSLAAKQSLPVTFRAAGTSLSGQAITDSILIKLTDSWTQYKISEQAEKISLQPGLIGARVNQYLAPFGRKIGPDPASINTCKVGGIAANNSSGMCCGTAQNSYSTLDSMRIVFADGAVLDTADNNSIKAFQSSHSGLLAGLKLLGEQTRDNQELRELIEHKFRLKNTTGYSINALVDFEDPIEILQHLMIGSEGTLGFISEITYNTVEEHKFKASSLVIFPDIETTCHAVAELKKTPVSSVELIDRAGLKSVQDQPGLPEFIKTLGDENCALLIESRAGQERQLAHQLAQIRQALQGFEQVADIPFTTDSQVCAQLWAIRKGLFPAVGAVRLTGTTVIIEDIAVPVEHLAEATRKLQGLFKEFAYHEAIIFGHALDGNLHFVFTQDFGIEAEVKRYEALMDKVTRLIAVDYQGSLKAEHGTGRNMAPFVELEWGEQAYKMMWQIKSLFDPNNLLNPGVILNQDNKVHLENLKALPAADEIIDKCIECGFCEPACPSKDLTLTPRQRITLWRKIQSLKTTQGDPEEINQLEQAYAYQGIDTCAATGLCAERCPVGINTGDLIRKLRSKKAGGKLIAKWTAEHFSGVTQGVRAGFKAADLAHGLLGTENMSKLSRASRNITGGKLPLWTPAMPKAAPKLKPATTNTGAKRKVVYLPSCASRTMAPARNNQQSQTLVDKTQALLEKAGFEVIFPKQIEKLCCGMPYDSKGYEVQATFKLKELESSLMEASGQGEYPIYFDTSPCTLRAMEKMQSKLKIFEPVGFIHKYLLDSLEFSPINEPVMLHVTCSSEKMGLAGKMKEVMDKCSTRVIVPEEIGCCGFAGDKGFNLPELNESALKPLKAQVPTGCNSGYSNSRTCEIGLSQYSGVDYQSVVYLVDRVTK